MDKLFVVRIPVKAPKGTDPSEVAAALNRMIGIGLDDAQDTVDDDMLDEKDDAILATSLNIGQPEVCERAGTADGDVAEHMYAMEGMLQSCIDRGVIDKPSADAAIKRSRQLRKRL